MTSESNRISGASTSYIDGVCRAWGWSWSEMGQVDDDGIDGLIYLRVKQVDPHRPTDRRKWKHSFTGGLIHVQIKTSSSDVATFNPEHIKLSIANLSEKKKLWLSSPLPVALIFVKAEPLGKTPTAAWWVDLKAPASYSTGDSIMIPLKNRFQAGIECRRPFARMATGQHRYLGLATIDMATPSLLPGKLDQMKNGAKVAAIDFYRLWKSSKPLNPDLGPILVNRTGWSHITRVGRPVSRILASFDLLPAAARIISEVGTWQVLRRGSSIRTFADGSWAAYEYIGLSALIKWPARASTEVMVILRRQTTFAADSSKDPASAAPQVIQRRTWFYSVYEPGRRKRII
jgi:hypothetical protein